jgi:hypothetical protein
MDQHTERAGGAGRGDGEERPELPPLPYPSLPEAQHVRVWPKLQPIGPPLLLSTFNFCFRRIIARGNCQGPSLCAQQAPGTAVGGGVHTRWSTRPRSHSHPGHARDLPAPTWVQQRRSASRPVRRRETRGPALAALRGQTLSFEAAGSCPGNVAPVDETFTNPQAMRGPSCLCGCGQGGICLLFLEETHTFPLLAVYRFLCRPPAICAILRSPFWGAGVGTGG